MILKASKPFIFAMLTAVLSPVNAQWGAVKTAPEHSCGNHYDWREQLFKDASQLLPSDHLIQNADDLV